MMKIEEGNSWDEVQKMDGRSFEVGERVMRRDKGKKWKPGYVTQVDPLLVTMASDDPKAKAFSWDEVKKMDGAEEVRRKESVSKKLISYLNALVLLD